MLKDSIVALVTPFNKDCSVDYTCYKNLLQFHIDNQTQGLLIGGTTGESVSLSKEEKLQLLEIAVKEVKSKIPIIFGAGTNNTTDSINFASSAKKIGADSILLVAPYYNKPTQKGLFLHFSSIAKAIDLPIYLYNVPGRTSVNIELNTVIKLATIKNIVGLKDAVLDLARPIELRKLLGKDFILLSGEDATVLGYRVHGGDGCVSVTANIIPRLSQNLHELCKKNTWEEARELQTKLITLHQLMFCETSPAPVKYALSLMGLCSDTLRIPLVGITAVNKEKVKQELYNVGVI